MRILFLDCNLSYINSTRNLLPLVFKEAAETIFYGPGYVSGEILKQGLDIFVEQNGPFDIAVATEHYRVNWHRDKEKQFSSYRNNYFFSFPKEHLFLVTEIFNAFKRLKILKLATLLETDYYKTDYYNFFIGVDYLKHFDYFLTCGEQFIKPIAELKYLARENFGDKADDNYYNFISANRCKVISLPSFVGENEFSFLPLIKRAWDWGIVGSQYWARQASRDVLAGAGIRSLGNNLSRFVYILQLLHLRPYGRPFLQKKIKQLFNEVIESSKYAYTCGSGLGYPVRKFFEIPAKETVLVCLPCNGFEALGFKDKVNAVACLPQDVLSVNEYLNGNPDKAQAIADAGQELVRQKHTVKARAEQIYQSLVVVKENKFAGSHWENGNFVIETKDK